MSILLDRRHIFLWCILCCNFSLLYSSCITTKQTTQRQKDKKHNIFGPQVSAFTELLWDCTLYSTVLHKEPLHCTKISKMIAMDAGCELRTTFKMHSMRVIRGKNNSPTFHYFCVRAVHAIISFSNSFSSFSLSVYILVSPRQDVVPKYRKKKQMNEKEAKRRIITWTAVLFTEIVKSGTIRLTSGVLFRSVRLLS